ncbi:MAG TPA: PLP-dependent aminotransferase family protein [Elusimicrobiota bacterium]|nr:PLP-dependent aminotransferase family protein [Elusimicrobiota bacterium]
MTPAGKGLARRMGRMRASTIREILKITKQKGIISFAGGLPAPELFPLQEFAAAMDETLRQDGVSALQYDITEGYPPLKEFLCDWLGRQGVACTPAQMMLTNGSQQALDLIGKILINPHDTVVVENPTYLGAIQAFNPYEPRYACVPIDEQGMRPEIFAKTLRGRSARLSYFVPTFQNPSGITMPEARRLAVLRDAHRHNVPVVEDNPYGYLRFSGQPQKTLYELARGRGVLYLSTFSKILSPGIRLGFVVADERMIQALVLAKQAADLQPNSLIQRAVYHYAVRGGLDRHIPAIIESYRRRAEIMLQAMERHFPPSARWVQPEGGMFIWCELPKGVSATAVFRKAIEHRVAYVTGRVFYANGGGDNTFRLNFTNSTEQQIRDGIERLGDVLKEACGKVERRLS